MEYILVNNLQLWYYIIARRAGRKRLARPETYYQLPTAKEVTRMVEIRKGRIRDANLIWDTFVGHQSDDNH